LPAIPFLVNAVAPATAKRASAATSSSGPARKNFLILFPSPLIETLVTNER
jgi:hypothetical protein